VLGQPDLFHNVTNFGGPQALWLQTGLTGAGVVLPTGIAIDADGHLYVADPGNSRVLGWHNAASFTNGAGADLVIGQYDFYSDLCNHTSLYVGQGPVSGDSLCIPSTVAADSAGNLYVADTGNHRVLEYKRPFANFSGAPIIGQSANLVFGQGDSFTRGVCNGGTGARDINGIGPDSLCLPMMGIAADAAGNL